MRFSAIFVVSLWLPTFSGYESLRFRLSAILEICHFPSAKARTPVTFLEHKLGRHLHWVSSEQWPLGRLCRPFRQQWPINARTPVAGGNGPLPDAPGALVRTAYAARASVQRSTSCQPGTIGRPNNRVRTRVLRRAVMLHLRNSGQCRLPAPSP